MFTRETIRPQIARLLLGLLLLMQINAVVFRHAHRLANGQIITHAHPFNIASKSCPLSPNPHSTHELILIDAISNAVFTPFFPLCLILLVAGSLVLTVQSVGVRPASRVLGGWQTRLRLRGPPVGS